jgi:GntR family transcriptional repressor for pyruvate dehydrogenase complex
MGKEGPKLERLPDGDKVAQIHAALQAYIIDGNLKPGDKIPPERQLAAQLGVSRFSLREALRVSKAYGLIEISRGCQPTVSKPSPAAAAEVIALTLRRTSNTLLELIEARQSVECGIARCAAWRAGLSHIRAMKTTIDALKDNKDNLAVCVEKDLEFHSILVKASGNIIFEIVLAPLAALSRELRAKTMKVDVQRAILGHRRILEAVIEKDSERAAQAMHDHLNMAEEDLRKIMAGGDGEGN